METERLLFRPYTMSDLDFYSALVADPRVMQYIGNGQTRTRAEAQERLESLVARFVHEDKLGLMLLVRKSDQQAVGHAGLVPQTIEGADELEIGFWITPAYWGQGYAGEAATALRDHGLHRLHRERLIALIQHGNAASAAVARKIGMAHAQDVVFREKRVMLYVLEQSKQSNLK
jgi:RimJ/RimL family protein N-acetyltransferase